MRRTLMIAIALLAAGAAQAAPGFDAPFSDNAVIQRDMPVLLRGTAGAGETVTVSLNGTTRSVTADAKGKWRAEFPALPIGGPYKAVAKGADGSEAAISNLLSGDVWLCSGQSNMEFAVSAAQGGYGAVMGSADDKVRLMTVPQVMSLDPEGGFPGKTPGWDVARPETVRDFSAACYFMGNKLHREQNVPFGLIDSSWGGTQIRPWIEVEAARALPGTAADADLLALNRKDPSAAAAVIGKRWGEWWRSRTGEKPGEEPWNAPDRRTWLDVPAIGAWEGYGDPKLADLNGMVWFRHAVTLTRDQAKQGATLDLGVLDDMDTVWVNGTPVGSSFGWSLQRSYKVPAKLLKAGANEIIVSVYDTYGPGGMEGPADVVNLKLGGGETMPLTTGWRYSVQTPDPGGPPRTPWETHAGLATLYDGMIAPLGPIHLKGIAWYQGESDAGIPGYDARMAALIAGWRKQFGQPQLPFLIVGIADWNVPNPTPRDSGSAQVRDEQRKAAEADAYAALITTIDIGDRTDIHPANKIEVGNRLARAATVLAYGGKGQTSGPLVASARRAGGDVIVSFKGVTGSLQAWSAPGPIGFELCGGGSCRFADARVTGADAVTVKGDGKPVDRIRYAWADSPVTNLFDEAPLPAAPFEVVVE